MLTTAICAGLIGLAHPGAGVAQDATQDDASETAQGEAGNAAEENAEGAAQPIRISEAFGDWRLECIDPADTEENAERRDRQCEIRTQVTRREEDGSVRPLLQLGIGQAGMKEGYWIVIQTPLGLALQEGVKLMLGEGDEESAPQPLLVARFLYCEKTHCRSQALLGDEQLDALGEADTAEVGFVGPAGNAIDIPLSLDGFSEARAGMSE